MKFSLTQLVRNYRVPGETGKTREIGTFFFFNETENDRGLFVRHEIMDLS